MVVMASKLASGKGGGKPDCAQAGGINGGNASEILSAIEKALV